MSRDRRKNPFVSMGGKMLTGGIVGGVVAMVFEWRNMRGIILGIGNSFEEFLTRQFFWIIGTLGILMLVFNLSCYLKLKGLVHEAENLEEDGALDLVDCRIELLSAAALYGNCILFILVFMLYVVKALSNTGSNAASTLMFMAIVVIYPVFYILIINQLKKYDPSKQGNPGSMKFQKDWIASCDEAEKMREYKVGYQSAQFGGKLLAIGFAATAISAMLMEAGTCAVYFTGSMWLIYMAVSGYYAIKSQKDKIS